jgi:hypothetical protein
VFGGNRQVSIFQYPVSKRFPPRKRGLRTLLVRSHQQEDSFPDVPYKTLLWTKVREDKELTQKSKGRRKNMPKELLRR